VGQHLRIADFTRGEQPVVKILRGVVRGRTIELECGPGIEDGRSVEVIVRSKGLPGPPPGWRPEGTEAAAGMMAESWTEKDDRILEEIERDRHRPSTSPLDALMAVYHGLSEREIDEIEKIILDRRPFFGPREQTP
jgi:hypothetical protein